MPEREDVTFLPSSVGALAASLEIGSDDPATPLVVVSLEGDAVGAPQVSLSTGALDFGAILVGATSPELAVTVTNLGGSPLGVSGLGIGGGDWPRFGIL